MALKLEAFGIQRVSSRFWQEVPVTGQVVWPSTRYRLAMCYSRELTRIQPLAVLYVFTDAFSNGPASRIPYLSYTKSGPRLQLEPVLVPRLEHPSTECINI